MAATEISSLARLPPNCGKASDRGRTGHIFEEKSKEEGGGRGALRAFKSSIHKCQACRKEEWTSLRSLSPAPH